MIVPNVLRQLREHIDRPLAARRRIGDDRFFDLHYAELMRDPISVMRSLYEWAGDDLTDSTERAMLDWLDACIRRTASASRRTPVGRIGRHPRRSGTSFRGIPVGVRHRIGGGRPMKAAVTTASTASRSSTCPIPRPTTTSWSSGWARAVYGSDIKAQPFAPAGMVMGHELGGEIVAVGSRADGWREGINVAVLPVVSCGSCQYCRAGAVSHCPSASYIGMGPAGGFAEYAAVPARHAFAVPAELPAVYSALVSRSLSDFTVCLRGSHRRRERAHRRCGRSRPHHPRVGLARGAVRVTVADPDPQRREMASALGATDVLASVSDAEAGAYEAAIECVGRPELPAACHRHCGRGAAS